MMNGTRRSGFALVAVLWALVVLAGVAIHFHATARADRLAVLNGRSEAQARWAARAGLAHSLHGLERRLASFTPLGAVAFRGDTLLPPLELTVDRIEIRVILLDHRARVNVNTAHQSELLQFLAALGLPAPEARKLAWSILEHRHGSGGAAHPGEHDYPSPTRPTASPGEGPFLAAEELRAVSGVTAEIYRLIEPHVTVSGDGRINVNTASRPALMAIPGVDRLTADRIVQRRGRAPYANAFELLQEMPGDARQQSQERAEEFLTRVAFGPRTVAVVVEAVSPTARAGAQLHATVELLGGPAFAVSAVAERPLPWHGSQEIRIPARTARAMSSARFSSPSLRMARDR
jgi:general secretion pathway protein K